MILNKKPSYLEVEGVGIRTFMRIKDELQTNFWDGTPLNSRANSHFKKLKYVATKILHEGQLLDNFISDNLKDPYYNWNPPTCKSLVAVCKNDIDNQNKIDDFDFDYHTTQSNDNVTVLPAEGHLKANTVSHQRQLDQDVASVSAEGYFEIQSDRQKQRTNLDVTLLPAERHFGIQSNRLQLKRDTDTDVTLHLDEENLQASSNGQTNTNISSITLIPVEHKFQVQCNNSSQLLPEGITKITELTLDMFESNYHLYAQKISCLDDGLFIRVILIKNKDVIFNYTYKIIGMENIRIATIVSADQVCNHYLVHAMKGDTFLCSLGDGHQGMHKPIIRNAHLTNFIRTLNKVKVKIGLYTIVSGHKLDWLQYTSAKHN